MPRQVKSKERVANFGEVFTNEREVNAMLDLVKYETENIESTFLEPACGDGNFLSEILKRKLDIVKSRYKKNRENYERYSIIAVSSIYGVDILQDNVEACILRLFNIWNDEYTNICKRSSNKYARDAVKHILKRNILCGDALTLLNNDGTPIIFPEWKLLSPNSFLIKRRDYELSEMLKEKDNSLELERISEKWEYDELTHEYMLKPVKEEIIDYRMVN